MIIGVAGCRHNVCVLLQFLVARVNRFGAANYTLSSEMNCAGKQ